MWGEKVLVNDLGARLALKGDWEMVDYSIGYLILFLILLEIEFENVSKSNEFYYLTFNSKIINSGRYYKIF